MRFATVNNLSLTELRAMAAGTIPDTITDMDFLETLAAFRCVIVPPWVVQTTRGGGLRKVARLVYGVDGELNKARMLLLLSGSLRQARSERGFGGRFSL